MHPDIDNRSNMKGIFFKYFFLLVWSVGVDKIEKLVCRIGFPFHQSIIGAEVRIRIRTSIPLFLDMQSDS